jgi:hypothetical protein
VVRDGAHTNTQRETEDESENNDIREKKTRPNQKQTLMGTALRFQLRRRENAVKHKTELAKK